MRISFTLSQADAFAQSEVRYHQCYDLCRSYAGIPVGTFWGPKDLYAFLSESGMLTEYTRSDDDERRVSIRGNEFVLKDIYLAINTRLAMDSVKIQLQEVKNQSALKLPMGRRIKDLNGSMNTLRSLLSSFEW